MALSNYNPIIVTVEENEHGGEYIKITAKGWKIFYVRTRKPSKVPHTGTIQEQAKDLGTLMNEQLKATIKSGDNDYIPAMYVHNGFFLKYDNMAPLTIKRQF
jgi:hypothetical protein